MPLTRDWWLVGRPVVKGQTDLDVTDFTTGCVVSESLSPNALRRSVVVPLPDLGAGTTSPLSSGFIVWTPSKAVIVAGFSLTPMSSWVQTTVQTTPVGTLYGGTAAIGTVNIPTTNAPVRGIALPGSVSSGFSIAAGAAVAFGLPTATSNGMDAPAHFLQIDYDSSA